MGSRFNSPCYRRGGPSKSASVELSACARSRFCRRMMYGTPTLSTPTSPTNIRLAGAVPAPAQADGPPARRPPREVAQRHPLPGPHRLPVAAAAQRLPALEYRPHLVPPLAERRHLGADPRGAAPAGPPPGRPRPLARASGRRQPVGQDDAGGRGAGLRQRQEGDGPQAAYLGGQPGLAAGRAGDGGRRPRRPRRLRVVAPAAVGGVAAAGGGLRRQPVHKLATCDEEVFDLAPFRLRGGAPAGGGRGLGEAAAAVGGGADVRLAGRSPAAEQGLRAAAGVERGDDPGEYDPL